MNENKPLMKSVFLRFPMHAVSKLIQCVSNFIQKYESQRYRETTTEDNIKFERKAYLHMLVRGYRVRAGASICGGMYLCQKFQCNKVERALFACRLVHMVI